MATRKVTVKYKGETFAVTEAQKEAYDALPRELRARLHAPEGNPLGAADLRELGKAVAILKKHKEVASTVMCPW